MFKALAISCASDIVLLPLYLSACVVFLEVSNLLWFIGNILMSLLRCSFFAWTIRFCTSSSMLISLLASWRDLFFFCFRRIVWILFSGVDHLGDGLAGSRTMGIKLLTYTFKILAIDHGLKKSSLLHKERAFQEPKCSYFLITAAMIGCDWWV